ncbi:hypothetical protein NBRC116594_05460 [Shimia sp. NS0008-38b]|uniref:DUF6477 family protein n=1 Tax=Shimia sp. NS0008-38b TaxID=3127653 RepID=UPI003106976C
MSELRRPRLLIRAARVGMEDYVRDQHLKRIIGRGKLPRHGAALVKLMDMETELDRHRRQGLASYSIVSHVDLLIAMMSEAHLLRATRRN